MVSVPRIDGGCIGPVLGEAAAKALAAAAARDPALSNLTATGRIIIRSPDELAVEMDVASAYPPMAVSKIWGIVAPALGGIGGWDLARASISLRSAP